MSLHPPGDVSGYTAVWPSATATAPPETAREDARDAARRCADRVARSTQARQESKEVRGVLATAVEGDQLVDAHVRALCRLGEVGARRTRRAGDQALRMSRDISTTRHARSARREFFGLFRRETQRIESKQDRRVRRNGGTNAKIVPGLAMPRAQLTRSSLTLLPELDEESALAEGDERGLRRPITAAAPARRRRQGGAHGLGDRGRAGVSPCRHRLSTSSFRNDPVCAQRRRRHEGERLLHGDADRYAPPPRACASAACHPLRRRGRRTPRAPRAALRRQRRRPSRNRAARTARRRCLREDRLHARDDGFRPPPRSRSAWLYSAPCALTCEILQVGDRRVAARGSGGRLLR